MGLSPAQFVLRQVVYGRRPASSEPALAAPVNTVLPTISGTETVGQTLSVTNGTWDNSPTSYAYQWKRDGANIGGATASTYLLVTADATKLITCTVTATNASGSTPATSGATGAIFGDPHIASVMLLVGFDGADGGTSAADESPVGRTLTFAGNAQIDTAQSKFGGASLLLDGSGDRVSAPDSTDWELTGEFTIEAWARFSSLPSTGVVMAHAVDSLTYGWFLLQNNAGGVGFRFERISGGSITHSIVSGTGVVTTGVWHHMAVDRDAANKLRLYVDGTMVASKTGATGASPNVAGVLSIGSCGPATTLNMAGHVDEVRITKGVARYASDGGFTVPTAAFPRS